MPIRAFTRDVTRPKRRPTPWLGTGWESQEFAGVALLLVCASFALFLSLLYLMHLQRIFLSLCTLNTLPITTTLLVWSVPTYTCPSPVGRSRISRWSPSCCVVPRSLTLSLPGTHNALDVALAHVYACLEKCFSLMCTRTWKGVCWLSRRG